MLKLSTASELVNCDAKGEGVPEGEMGWPRGEGVAEW